jgi:predicted DNA-binding transcriptional regulator YafY
MLQALRRHRQPVTGAALAGELGISLRTLYRDIGSLKAQGAAIEGEAGLGFLMKPGFMLPPLMFSEDELEALVLGAHKAGQQTERTIWPFALAYFDRVRMVVAWCERRRGFRNFRADRISAPASTGERYPRRRQVLLREWREQEGIPAQ